MAHFSVHMLAYQPEYRIRNVVIPDDYCGDTHQIRSKVWEQGQNMFQNQPSIVSVARGDVMEINGEYHLILDLGYVVLSGSQFEVYKSFPQVKRQQLSCLKAADISTILQVNVWDGVPYTGD